MKENSMYLRADLSVFGVLPPFVEFEKPIPYLEPHYRGWKFINGLQLEMVGQFATKPEDISTETDESKEDLIETFSTGGLKVSVSELDYHIWRLYRKTGDELGKHLGEMKPAWCFDMIMWAGENYYKDPADFIQECRMQGLNKRISNNVNPPDILRGRTKLYVIHPRAICDKKKDTYTPGIIGYSYLTRVIYTRRKDGKIPKWIDDLKSIGRVEVVDVGEPIEVKDENQKSLMDMLDGLSDEEKEKLKEHLGVGVKEKIKKEKKGENE